MRLTSSFQFLTLVGAVSALTLTPHLGWAQPEAGNRGIVPVPEKPALTAQELEKLLGGPTLVTYSGQDVPIAQVVSALQAAAGLGSARVTPAVLPPGTPATISVDWKGVPFWTAAAEVEKLTGLRWTQNAWNGLSLSSPIAAQNADLNGTLVAQSAYVKVYALSIAHTAVTTGSFSAQMAPMAPTDTTKVNLMVYLDPKIKLTSGSLRALDVKVPGTKAAPPGATIADAEMQNILIRTMRAGMGGQNMVTPLSLDLPNGIAAKTVIPQLNATVRFTTNLTGKVWKVDDVLNAADAQETQDGSQFVVLSGKTEGKMLHVNLEIDGEAGNVPGGSDFLGQLGLAGNFPPGLAGQFNLGPMVGALGGGAGGGVVNGAGGVIVGGAEAIRNGAQVRIIETPGLKQQTLVFPDGAGAQQVQQPLNPPLNPPAPGRFQPGIPLGFRNLGRSGPFQSVIIRDSNGKDLSYVTASSKRTTGVDGVSKVTGDVIFVMNTDTAGPFSLEWALPTPSRNVDTAVEMKDVKVP